VAFKDAIFTKLVLFASINCKSTTGRERMMRLKGEPAGDIGM
jgi:hypothetical protein